MKFQACRSQAPSVFISIRVHNYRGLGWELGNIGFVPGQIDQSSITSFLEVKITNWAHKGSGLRYAFRLQVVAVGTHAIYGTYLTEQIHYIQYPRQKFACRFVKAFWLFLFS